MTLDVKNLDVNTATLLNACDYISLMDLMKRKLLDYIRPQFKLACMNLALGLAPDLRPRNPHFNLLALGLKSLGSNLEPRVE